MLLQTRSFYNLFAHWAQDPKTQLSCFSKREASTTWLLTVFLKNLESCHASPNEKLLQRSKPTAFGCSNSCHASPNEKLLQRELHKSHPIKTELSCFSKREASTTVSRHKAVFSLKVVMLLQTRSFYNEAETHRPRWCWVVMLLQTRSFYNTVKTTPTPVAKSCHASPNEKLLQRSSSNAYCNNHKLSCFSKREASTTMTSHSMALQTEVVMLLQTRSFYNMAAILMKYSLKLSCFSKREASTTG